MDITPEEREVGRENYHSAVTAYEKFHRRDFLRNTIAGGAAIAGGLGAMYFSYAQPQRPVRVCVIGTGDEGGVLIGALNPKYVDVVSICDIRPSSIHRAFHGDWSTANTRKHRPGLMKVYGWKTEDKAKEKVKIYSDYKQAISDPAVEAIIIALPLHLHAPVAVEAMKKGKHVMCEKLMAHNVAQCKLMAQTAEAERTVLSVGHQRHYSLLYDNAVKLIQWGLLGQIHHIRAQWHRGNLPGKDTWCPALPGGEVIVGTNKRIDKIADDIAKIKQDLKSAKGSQVEQLQKKLAQWEQLDLDQTVDAAKYGYEEIEFEGRKRTALEELLRWRLWNRTGGGLMAELGSHQLDAASIFISALSGDPNKKVHPLNVHAVGGRHLFPKDRDAEDHVYCMFEFPGQKYDYDFPVGYRDVVNQVPDKKKGIESFHNDDDKKIVVTYSSINGNGFGGYGEVVMGTRGTIVLERERDVMLYKKASKSAKAGVKVDRKGTPTIDTTESGDPAPSQNAAGSGPVSRGYKEEIEHWAYCIESKDWSNQPRCNGKVALGDAVIALVAKQAIANSRTPGKHGFVEFKPEWFDYKNPEVPEATDTNSSAAIIEREKRNLGLA